MKVPQEVLDDFRNHLFFCFKHLGLGEPTRIQYEIARQIQEGPDDQIIAAGRGTGKSTITACLASWIWLQDCNKTGTIPHVILDLLINWSLTTPESEANYFNKQFSSVPLKMIWLQLPQVTKYNITCSIV